ncbi:MAG: hypothetical protein SV201_04880 [Pseudomonadota bacterium]|nr:hypothetical protein [Pseudomonadota bacterium]
MSEIKDNVFDSIHCYANEHGDEKTLKLLCRLVGAYVVHLDQEGAVIYDRALGVKIDVSITHRGQRS